jgi:acyl carrier protein
MPSLSSSSSPSIREQIIQQIVTMEPRLRDVRLDDEVTLQDLQLDSLKLVELGVRLEESLGSLIYFDDWMDDERAKSQGAFSLGSLVAFVEKAAPR